MPPVAFSDTDPRRWGFQADSAAVESVGVLSWPGSEGLSSNLGVGGGGRVRTEENGSDVHAAGGASESPGRLAVDEGERRRGSGFRDSPPDHRGRSPDPRPMDPRIIVDSNNIVGGSHPGVGGGGPPSRQGSPFSRPFDFTPAHQHLPGSMESSSSGLAGGSSYGVGRVHHQMTSVPSARSGVGPSRRRSAFEEPMGPSSGPDHLYGIPSSSENLNQGADSTGGMLLGSLGGGRTSMGTSAGPLSLGVGRLAPQQPQGVGTSPVAWHGQGQQPQQHQQARHAQQQQSQKQQQQPQPQQPQHRQQQHHRQQGRPGSSSSGSDDGLMRRVGGNGGVSGPWGSTMSANEDSMSMALASVPHGASSLPAAAVPTVLERFPGFVRCVMDIAPEVVGWVIGRSGAHIKEMKHRSGCGMWVDQKDLKLYITGADMPRIHAAARLVGDLISKAPVNVNSAGVEDEVTSHMIECPPHLIGLLIGRGGSTIKRIKEESRANVVINQKMMKVIVSGIPQSVRLGVAMIEDVITFGRSAEHSSGAMGPPGSFLDFPDAFSGMGNISDYDDGAFDRFLVRAAPSMPGGGRLAPPPPPFAGGPSNLGGGGGSNLPSSVAFSGAGSFDGLSRPHRAPPASAMHHSQQQQHHLQQQHHAQQLQQEVAASAAASVGGGGGKPAESGYEGYEGSSKDTDWSVFSSSSQMFNIGAEGQASQQQQQQHQPSVGPSSPASRSMRAHSQLSGLPPTSSSGGGLPRSERDNSGGVDHRGISLARSSSAGGPPMGIPPPCISRSGSVSSGGSTPPLSGRPSASAAAAAAVAAASAAPWSIISTPLRGEGGSRSVSGGGAVSGGSPGPGVPVAGTLQSMQRLSISSLDDSGPTGQSLGQASRQRERAGTPVGSPVDLAEFLGDMELGQYARVLMDNEIDLEAVQLMADSDFQDIGIPKGPRVKMLYALRTNRHPPKSGGLSAMRTFLTSLGLERYCKAFEDAEVDLSAVDVMEESDYAELGVAKGPRLKMMNVLAKAAGSLNSSSVGAASTGSNTGSAFSVSPELRHSPPPPPQAQPHATSQAPASTPLPAGAVSATYSPLCAARSSSSTTGSSDSPRSRATATPERSSGEESATFSSSSSTSTVSVASAAEAASSSKASATADGREEIGGQHLPPSWDDHAVIKAERPTTSSAMVGVPSVEAWMASALGCTAAEAESAETGASSVSDEGVRSP